MMTKKKFTNLLVKQPQIINECKNKYLFESFPDDGKTLKINWKLQEKAFYENLNNKNRINDLFWVITFNYTLKKIGKGQLYPELSEEAQAIPFLGCISLSDQHWLSGSFLFETKEDGQSWLKNLKANK